MQCATEFREIPCRLKIDRFVVPTITCAACPIAKVARLDHVEVDVGVASLIREGGIELYFDVQIVESLVRASYWERFARWEP